MNNADAAGQAASRTQRQGSEFAAPLGSAKSGRLVFASGASRLTADLRGLELRSFEVSGGASSLTIDAR
jgi:hypothetical protein